MFKRINVRGIMAYDWTENAESKCVYLSNDGWLYANFGGTWYYKKLGQCWRVSAFQSINQLRIAWK